MVVRRDLAVEVLGYDFLPAVHEVSQCGDQLGIVALREVIEAPGGPLVLGSVDGQVVAERIGIELLQIVPDPNRRAARFADLLLVLAGKLDWKSCKASRRVP